MNNLSNQERLTTNSNPSIIHGSTPPANHRYQLRSAVVCKRPSKQTQTFRYTITPYLKDSNSYGNIYFSRYFEWQGMCREAWFTQCICSDMLNMQGGFLTKAAHNSYNEEVLPFQRITCLLNVMDIKRTAFNLLFRFYNEDSKVVVSEGCQTVVFINLTNKKISKLPAEVVEKVRRFETQQFML